MFIKIKSNLANVDYSKHVNWVNISASDSQIRLSKQTCYPSSFSIMGRPHQQFLHAAFALCTGNMSPSAHWRKVAAPTSSSLP